MTAAENLPVLAGVDGSAQSAAAVGWAVTEARLRRRPLWLVHAYPLSVAAAPMMGPPYHWPEDAARGPAEEVLDRVVAEARAQAPDLVVTGELAVGAAGEVLVEMSGRAHLVVVGHRGHGGFAALLLGSVAATLAAHASGPVIVARAASGQVSRGAGSDAGQPRPSGTGAVVVGVDGSVPSHAAIGFAFEEADLRGVPVHAVHAWRPPAPPHRADVRPDQSEIETAERHRVAQWLLPWQQKFPQVPVTSALVTGQAAGALVEAGWDATLLVVGSRGRGAFTGLLGSVSQQVIHHATGPVAVVR